MPSQDVDISIDEKAKKVTIVMPLIKARASKSGKTMVIATTSGNARTDAKFNGKEVIVGINMYYKPDDEDDAPPAKAAPKKKGKPVEDDEDDE